ncbi:MAG TPA: GNAT family N-acetyltransferase, partial [Comamonas denitrificans]|nr:GNAT family N-acetyltransferase [Comamonas denitrificans]
MLDCQAPTQLLPMAAQWLPAVAAVDAAAQAHPWTQRQFADALASGYHGAMLVRHGEVLGFFVAMQAVDEVHLLSLSVAPQHQGLGHGRCLLHALHEWARQVAAHTLWLEVRSSNAR